MKILLLVGLCLPLTISAQWTDGGSFVKTDDNVIIGPGSSSFSLNVAKDANGWQGRFSNQAGTGADVFLAHGAGHGMHIRGWTTGSHYTLQLFNANQRTNIFYNNGNVGLGLAGNVGIGTASPTTKFDVSGRATCNTSFTVGQHNDDYRGLVVDNGASFGWRLMELKNVNGTQMVVKGNGNVGIGTDTPDNELDVKGTIRAEEILCELGWSDYVFYDDYDVPTLEEEEKHIEENGHLLGFESEQDMEGVIPLADVSRRQQAKIEEMMLHLIELKKGMDELKEEVEELKDENEELKEENEELKDTEEEEK